LRARDARACTAAIVKHLQQVYERANVGHAKRTDRNLGEILSRYA
jgi:hypothetical protein